MSFDLEIVNPEQKVFQGKAQKLTVPSPTGKLTILPYHTPLFTTLSQGEVKYTDSTGKVKAMEIARGMLEVENNKCLLLVESLDSSKEVVKLKIKAAQKKAQTADKEEIKATGVIPTEDAFRRSFLTFADVRRKRRMPSPTPSPQTNIK